MAILNIEKNKIMKSLNGKPSSDGIFSIDFIKRHHECRQVLVADEQIYVWDLFSEEAKKRKTESHSEKGDLGKKRSSTHEREINCTKIKPQKGVNCLISKENEGNSESFFGFKVNGSKVHEFKTS